MIKFLFFLIVVIQACTGVDRKKYYIREINKDQNGFILSVPQNIIGRGSLSVETMARYLTMKNNKIDYEYALYLATLYVEESEIEGINHDVAFAQMCLETGYLRFGNQVRSNQNNFAGIGATDDGSSGNIFPNPRIGIRAQIQHLKAYASFEDIRQPIVDPRFKYVKRGIAPKIYDLGGKWASDPNYGEKIEKILKELYNFNTNDYTLNR